MSSNSVAKPRAKRSVKRIANMAKPQRIHGKGAYGPWEKHGRKIGRSIGALYGAGDLGENVGSLAKYVGRLFGSGDYKVGEPPKVNSLFQGSASDMTKSFVSFGERSIRIKHREYLGDVRSSATANTFQQNTYQINPGLPGTFPWLSQLAPAFQFYKWHGLVVEFKTTSSDALNSTNTALGQVVGACDYNSQSLLQPFNNKQEMLNYYGAIDAKPSDSWLMGVECDPSKLPLSQMYVRYNNASQGDLRMYDYCSVSVATNGFQGTNVNCGELYMIYDVEFFAPILLDPGSQILASYANLQISSLGDIIANNQNQGLLGASGTMTMVYDGLKITNAVSTATAYQQIIVADRNLLRPNMFLKITWHLSGSAGNNLRCPLIGAVSGTTTSAFSLFTGVEQSPTVNTVLQPDCTLSFYVRVTDVNALITPSTGIYTPALGYPNAGIISSFTNPAVGTSVPAVSIISAYLRVEEVDPLIVQQVVFS